MDEVTIWCGVLEKIGWKFIDEETAKKINKIIYWKEGQYFNIYFDFKTSKVSSISIKRTSYDQIDKANVDKKSFCERYKDIFREVKLEKILNK